MTLLDGIEYVEHNINTTKIIDLLIHHISSNEIGEAIIECNNPEKSQLFLVFSKLSGIDYFYMLSLNPNYRIKQIILDVTSQV